MPPAYVDPCRGHFPHRQAAGCCPIAISAANRVVTGGARPATTALPVPLDICQAIDTNEVVYLNRDDHTNDVAFDVNGSTAEELMNGVQSGVVDGGTVMSELARRIPGAGDADARSILTSSVTALRALIDTGIVMRTRQESNGNLLRLWILAGKRTISLSGPLVSVDEHNGGSMVTVVAAGGSSSAAARTKLQIRRIQKENQFDMTVYMWSVLAHTLGIMTFEISVHFMFEVVHIIRMKHKENFWTAQEYLIESLDLIDRGVCKASEVANHDRNLMLDNARRLGLEFAAAFSQKGDPLAAPVEGGGVAWNGRHQRSDSKAGLCQAFNRNKAHDNPKHLLPDGTCRFRHLCNHWVNDKGPSGKCLREGHGWHNCTNPAKCSSPLE